MANFNWKAIGLAQNTVTSLIVNLQANGSSETAQSSDSEVELRCELDDTLH